MNKKKDGVLVFEAKHTQDEAFNDCDHIKQCASMEYYAQRVAYLETLVKKYKYDFLTGLMMKLDFETEFNGVFEEYQFAGTKFNMAIMDINGLHNVNRLQGYGAGDKLIKSVAYQLRASFSFHQVFRISGDEFVVIVRETTIDAVALKNELDTIDNVEYIFEPADGYTSPKHMFKMLDKKLSALKARNKTKRI